MENNHQSCYLEISPDYTATVHSLEALQEYSERESIDWTQVRFVKEHPDPEVQFNLETFVSMEKAKFLGFKTFNKCPHTAIDLGDASRNHTITVKYGGDLVTFAFLRNDEPNNPIAVDISRHTTPEKSPNGWPLQTTICNLEGSTPFYGKNTLTTIRLKAADSD